MKDNMSEILRGFRNYLGEGVLVAAIGFATTPLLTRVMSVSDYGILNVFLTYVSIASIIFVLNIHSSVGRYYYDNKTDFSEFLGTVTLVCGILFVTAAWLFFHYSDYNVLMAAALLFLTAAAVIESIFRQIYQAKLESQKVAFSSILKSGLILLLIILLALVHNQGGVEIPLIARVIAGALVLFYFLVAVARHVRFGFDFTHIKFCFFYSVPLIPYALSSIVLAQFDRIMVQEMVDSASAGLYSFAYNIGFIMGLVVGALNSSFYPIFFANYNAQDYQQHDASIVKTQNIIMLAFVFLLLFSEEIGVVLGPNSYAEAIKIVPTVVLGYVFYSFFSIYNRNFDYAKRTYISTAVMVIAVVFNILTNYLLIPIYGYVAAAYTTLGSYCLLFLLSWFASNYILKIHSVAIWTLLKPLVKLLPILLLSLMVKVQNIAWYYAIAIDVLLMAGAIWTIFPTILGIMDRMLVKVK